MDGNRLHATCEFPRCVVVRARGPSVEGLGVHLCFEMKAKNNFNDIVFLGPGGIAKVSADELLRYFDQEWSESPMDYVDPRTGFTGRVTATVMSNSQLQSAVEAFKFFHKFLSYPAEYEQKLSAAVARGQNPNDYELELEME